MVVVLALIGCMGFCIYKKCFNKGKKPKKVRERKGGRGRRKKDKDGEEGEEKKVSLLNNTAGSPMGSIFSSRSARLKLRGAKRSKRSRTRSGR